MANLKQGSKGKLVESLQKQLNATKIAGAKLKVDGIFGPKTYEAVKTFQKREKISKLKVDGVVGSKTQTALDGYQDPKILQKKVVTAKAALAKFQKHLEQMQKLLKTIQAQKKKLGQSAQKPIDKMKREVKHLEYLADSAADTCSDMYSCMAGGLVSQGFQDRAYNLRIDVKDYQSMQDENQKDFDRRIADAKKRIDDTVKKITQMKKELSKIPK